MKKTFLYVLIATLFISGCLSKEQDDKFTSFRQRIAAFFSQRLGMHPAEKPREIPEGVLLDAQGKPLFAEQKTSQEQPAVEPNEQENSAANTPQTNPPVVAPKRESIKATLFIHSDSPQSKRLKADRWADKFQQKYPGSIILIEYDMKNPASKEPLRKMMRKHNLSTVTVPILFLEDQVIQGYPFDQEDQAAEKAFATAAQKKQLSAKKQKHSNGQYMEIIMEDTLQTRKTNTKASPRDSRAMQLALAGVEKNNQATLNDMGSLFGEDTKAQAYLIISRTERLLRNKASSSPDYKTYLSTQKTLLQLQEKELNELMRQNAKKLRTVRG